ncbi:MAG: DUF2335 domain-containing protein [Lachnospiraceae bacterium]|nr:DUF2335 domain-containing protein [Lachnospiraceae bacterium]
MSEILSEENAEILPESTDAVEHKDEKTVSPEIDNENTEIMRKETKTVFSEFSGPLPPPSIIQGYENVIPGAAERILAMAEKQSEHRQLMERTMIQSDSRDSLLGIVAALILGVGCLVTSCVIAISVPQNAGAICSAAFGITGIGSIVGPFLKIRKKDSSKDEDGKNKSEAD